MQCPSFTITVKSILSLFESSTVLYQYFILNYGKEIVFTFFIRFSLCLHFLEVILKPAFYDLILL